MTMNKPRGLYIHVPFCLSKCPYCDFYSVAFSKSAAERYAAAVVRNLKRYDEPFDTVYFGGGTPILLSGFIGEILSAAEIPSGAEITAEANPCLCTKERLSELREAGVNRISIGVQSLQDEELSALGRRHSAAQAEAAILSAYAAGFDNISADLMLGIPNQTQQSLAETAERLCALPISHVSAYLLKIEPQTPFGKNPPQGTADEDAAAELYLSAVRMLSQRGFLQYEISNFAKTGRESRHNLKYWRREEYLGIGPAAHSFYDGQRFAVPRDLARFLESERQFEELTDGAPDEFEERVMLGLRLAEGIPEELWKPLSGALKRIPKQYYRLSGGRLSLTPEGFLLSNEIIALLLSERL